MPGGAEITIDKRKNIYILYSYAQLLSGDLGKNSQHTLSYFTFSGKDFGLPVLVHVDYSG